MKLNIVLAAVLALAASASQAASYTFTTDATANSTGGGSGAHVTTGGLSLMSGDSFTVTTDASQIWYGATGVGDPNAAYLTTNADGAPGYAYAPYLYGIGATKVGTLVAEINGEFRIIGAGTNSFTAWGTGEIEFFYADVNNGDNAGHVVSTLTTAAAVPEPANMALFAAGLGLMGLVARRRSQK